ncbi:MAG: hypothetical protein J5640_05080 [Bacteroidales bacterium]|nr:hypothetical protein [Bacteroidales bacterium]
MTYKDAERQFIASLTKQDTLNVVALGTQFFTYIEEGNCDAALDMLNVLDGNVLYGIADESKDFLRPRFVKMPSDGWSFLRYSFSTAGVNDLVYLYGGLKLVFNPVKVGDNWFLTLKDGYQSSNDLNPSDQINPNSPAPYPIRLNKKN